MADTTLKFKRGQESKVNSLAKEDGSVIFGINNASSPSTLHLDATVGSSVQRLGVAVASASSANTASTATKLRTARKINDASFDGTKDVDITELHPVVITDQSVDLNTLRLTGDFLGRKLYICGTDGGSSNITHKPETANEGFILLVEQLRWYNGSADYANKQTLEYRTSHKVYIRYSDGATWGNWILQSDDGIASTANYAKNSGALGGSSLSQVLASAGGGSAFVGLDTTTNNVVKLTRANGGTVQKTINNVSHATSASIATTANIAKALPATVTLGNGNGAMIDQNGANYRQRIRIEDNGSANDNVFVFQQSANAGSTYTDLFRILDNGTVVANTFTGALNGTANYAKNSGQLQGHTLTTVSTGTSATFANHIPYISGSALELSRYIDFHGDGTSRDYSVRLDTGTPSKLIVSGPSASTVQAGYFQGVAQNSNALGGSSLSQILASAGGGKYLPLAGGTMTGTLNFSNGVGITGTMASSDSWRIIGGGTSDAGYLEIATRDNANEPIYVRQYGANNSLARTVTLLDGSGNSSFPGQVSASTLASSVIRGPGELTYRTNSPQLYQLIDLSSTVTYNSNTWYPILGSSIPYNGFTQIGCHVQLNSGTKPSWSTHSSGFTCNLDVLAKANGWGTTGGESIVRDYSWRFTSNNVSPISYNQLGNSSRPVIYMRGGGKYRIYTSNPISWQIITAATTLSQQSIKPESSCPALSIYRSTVYANLSGTASSASNASALGGSSLSQILAQSGSGNAFTALDTATNNVVKLTRANGGTVQKTINNVANATSASIASTAKVANKIGSTTVGSATKPIYLNAGTPTQLTSITSSFAAAPQDLNNTDLNTVRSPGEYFGGRGNGCANKPSGVDAFALEVRRAADGWYVQIMYASNNQQKTYIRYYNGSSWTGWVTDSTSSGNNAYNSVTVSNATLKFGRLNGATGTTVTVNNVANATSAANANLLDGIDSSRFIYGSGAHGVNSSYSNASSIWKSGFYDLSTTGGSASGLPTTNAWHWLIEAGHRSNSTTYRFGLQIAAPNDTGNNLYYRINPQSGNGTWRTIIDNHNYTNYAADRTAFTVLDTTTNNVIKLTRANGVTVQKTINNVAHATSADRLGGYGVTTSASGTSATFVSKVPLILSGGVLEISRYIDFHGDTTSRDYSVRLDTGTASKLVVTGPSASTVTASYFDGVARNSNQLGGHSSTYFVSKAELGSGSSTGSMNVDAARRIVNSDVNTRNAQSFRVGTPGSGSWTGFPSSYLYSASSTAALKTNAYYRQQVGVLHVAAGTAYHDLVFADAGTDNGIVRVSSKGDTGLIIDTTNYATYSTRYNALSSSTLTVTTAGGVNIDGGSY